MIETKLSLEERLKVAHLGCMRLYPLGKKSIKR